MNRKIVIALVILIITTIHGYAQTKDIYEGIKQDWQVSETNIPQTCKELFVRHKQLQSKYKGDKIKSSYNDYYLISLLDNFADKVTAKELSKLPVVNLKDEFIVGFLGFKGKFLNSYYTLKSIKKGESYEESKSGMYFNTSIGGALKKVDYELMNDVFSSSNEDLIHEYLKLFRMAIRYNGLTKEMVDMRPLIEKNVKDCEAKTDILNQYENYKHLMSGMLAPEFALKDYKGVEYKLSDYRGKVVVIDVWATWCSGCIEKLPTFLKIRDKYKERDDIVFTVISIDNKAAHSKWKFSHPKYNLMNIPSLIASEEETDFQKEYNITGIPRYFIIDKKGKIVTVYAPSPGDEFIEMIDNTLKK